MDVYDGEDVAYNCISPSARVAVNEYHRTVSEAENELAPYESEIEVAVAHVVWALDTSGNKSAMQKIRSGIGPLLKKCVLLIAVFIYGLLING